MFPSIVSPRHQPFPSSCVVTLLNGHRRAPVSQVRDRRGTVWCSFNLDTTAGPIGRVDLTQLNAPTVSAFGGKADIV